MPLPEQDEETLRAHLKKGIEDRQWRASVKKRLKSGEIELHEVLRQASEDQVIAKTRVLEILESMPQVGPVRARRLMERLDISPSRRLRGLGVNQRERLLAEFSDR
jgi:hypothetical protein